MSNMQSSWLTFCLVVACAAMAEVRAEDAAVKRTEDVIYGRKYGMALTIGRP